MSESVCSSYQSEIFLNQEKLAGGEGGKYFELLLILNVRIGKSRRPIDRRQVNVSQSHI